MAKDHTKKAQEILIRAYNLSDAFEESVEDFFNFLDEIKEKHRKKFGENSERYKCSDKAVRQCREILKKIQTNHAEGFELLMDFVKKHAKDGELARE